MGQAAHDISAKHCGVEWAMKKRGDGILVVTMDGKTEELVHTHNLWGMSDTITRFACVLFLSPSSRKSSGKDRKSSAGRTSDRMRGSASRDRLDNEESGSDGEGGIGGVRGGNTASGSNNENLPLILFNQSKNELKSLNNGFKQLQNRLRTQYRFMINKDDLTRDRLEGVRAIIFSASRTKFETSELKVLQEFMVQGGGIMLLGSEPTEPIDENGIVGGGGDLGLDGEGRSMQPDDYTHVNRLSENFGIAFQNDALVRTVYAKEYFHPKEVLIKSAGMVPSMDRIAEGRPPKDPKAANGGGSGGPASSIDDDEFEPKLEIVYPFGCTLRVSKPATPLITSGVLSFPASRALVACARVGRGTLIGCGAVQMFVDEFISKADNFLLLQNLFGRLTSTIDWKSESVDGDRLEFGEIIPVPDTESLAERLRSCLQETEDLPVDFTTLFDHNLFKFDTHLIPEAVKLYERLNVKHEPLSLIPPQFEVPLPPLQPAVFMPCMRELPPPALDLFDLDEHFSSEKLRLAQLTNKCTDKDLEYFVCEAGEILGIADQLRSLGSKVQANKILEFILRKLVDWKKLDREVNGGPGGHESAMYPPHHQQESQSYVLHESQSPQNSKKFEQQQQQQQSGGGELDLGED